MLAEELGFGSQDGLTQQILLYIGPTTVVALVSVGLGLAVLRRDDGLPWTRGVAGGAVIVSGIVVAISVVGTVVALVADGPGGPVL